MFACASRGVRPWVIVRRSDVRVPRPSPSRRNDVEGLRALAVLLVVAYHVWFGRVSGGVDVFLLVSAFFLTGGLVRRLERGERVSPPREWARIFSRLVPTAAVVVTATVGAALLLLPAPRWRSVLVDGIGSMTYSENWVLAHRAVDYYAADKGSASPLQHMWSLSVQGQLFLVWPLLVLACAAVARRTSRVGVTAAVAAGLGVVTLASFAWSVHTTAARQSFAYFDTTARLWELGLGGLLALLAGRVRVGPRVAAPLGWVGVAGLVSCGVVLDVQGSFPGWAALWPLVSAAAVVLAGGTTTRWGTDRVLALPPLVGLGGVSYALYLVHWPVLVLWLATTGRPHAGAADGALLVTVSLVLAWALTRVVERPLRRLDLGRAAPRRAAVLALGTAGLVVAVAGAGVLTLDAAGRRGAELSRGAVVAGYPGARAVHSGEVAPAVALDRRLPAVTALRDEFATLPAVCHGTWADPALGTSCTQLEPEGAASATVLVVGDSHAEQWLAALEPLARAHRWRLVALLKGACSFGEASTRTGACARFNEDALAYATSRPVDLVVVVSTAAHPTTPAERVVTGLPGAVRALTSRGTPVVGLRDNPRFPSGVVSCALTQGDEACTRPVSEKLAATDPAATLAGRGGIPGFTALDLTDLVCPGGRCTPSVGNVWVYLDDNHLTRSFAATLAPALEERLDAAGVLPGPVAGTTASRRNVPSAPESRSAVMTASASSVFPLSSVWSPSAWRSSVGSRSPVGPRSTRATST